MRKGNWVNLTSQKNLLWFTSLFTFLVLRFSTKQDWNLKAYSRSKMVMQIQFARFINFPMAISIEVGFMNPLPTKCSRQFCMQVQEGKNFAKFCFSFAGYRGGRGKFKMPRFLSSEKSEVRRKKSREENDYGSIASLLRNEVSTKDKNHWKKSHIQSTSKINSGKNWELFIYILFRANLQIFKHATYLVKKYWFYMRFLQGFLVHHDGL